MNKLLTISVLFFSTSLVFAQQESQSSQFMINPFMTNPAYSSSEDISHLQTGFRKQWNGIKGAPTSKYISYHTPINKPDWARTHPGDFHNWHGTGALIKQDQIGAFSFLKAQANYSFNIGLTEGENYGYYHVDGLRVALGTFLEFQNYNVDKAILEQSLNSSGGYVFNSLAANDRTLIGLPESQNNFNLGLGGLIYYLEKYYLGLSVSQVLNSNKDYNYSYANHYYISGTYKTKINERSFLIPSLLVKKVFAAPWSYELNIRYDLDDKYFLGMAYRNEDAASVIVGYRSQPKREIKHFRETKSPFSFEVFYSYDITVNSLRNKDIADRSKGSHEITLGFYLSRAYRERNAEDTWR